MLSGFCPLVTLADDVFDISAVAMLRVAGDMLAEGAIVVVTAMVIDLEFNACGLAAVSSEKPSRCCSASFSCWTMTAFDSDHALHDCKPSYHV